MFQFFSCWEVCLPDGAVPICSSFFSVEVAIHKCWAFVLVNATLEFEWWLVILQFPRSFHPCVQQAGEWCLSVWVTSSEEGSQMNKMHLRVASHLRNQLIASKTSRLFIAIYSSTPKAWVKIRHYANPKVVLPYVLRSYKLIGVWLFNGPWPRYDSNCRPSTF